MNKELFDTFGRLNDTAKEQVKHRLKDSPVALRLFHFLEQCKNRNFRNNEVVRAIYQNDTATAYNVLENRYFKLRKKFFEEYFSANVDTADILTDEERELMRCRHLIQKNEKEAAYTALCNLEKECWEKNIFELLPQIIDNLIFCNQVLNKLERNTSLYKRLLEAIQLQADIHRVIAMARKVYDINYKKGVVHAKAELAGMKDIARRNKEYPRFVMCYHHVSLYYKLGSTGYVEEMQVISRHFHQWRALTGKYPHLPLVTYRKNYSFHQQMHQQAMIGFYHYNRCEFEQAYREILEFWNLIEKKPEVYGMYRSESVFFNLFHGQRSTLRFSDADKTIDAYMQFLKENKYTSKIPYAYTLRAILYADAWPYKKDAPRDFLLKQVKEYLKAVSDDANVQTSAAEVHLTLSRFHFLDNQYQKALAIISEPEIVSFLKTEGLDVIYNEFYSFYAQNDGNAEERVQLKKKISREAANTKRPTALIHLRWMLRILDDRK